MLDGIGARGGKKDFNQTLKNQSRRQKEQKMLIEEMEKKKQSEVLEKKKRILPFTPNSPMDLSKEVTNSKDTVKEVEQVVNLNLEKKENTLESLPPKKKLTLDRSVDMDRIHSILEQINPPTPVNLNKDSDSFIQEVPTPPVIEDEVQTQKDSTVLEEAPKKTAIEPHELEEESTDHTKNEQFSEEYIPRHSPIVPKVQEEKNLSSTLTSEKQTEAKSEQEKILEFKVAKELERLLKDNRYELKKLYTELDSIEKDTDDLYEVLEAERAIEEIEKLLAYLEQIKRQLEVINRSHNLDLIYQLDDPYFSKLVEEYKNTVKDQKIIEDQVQDFKKSEEYTSLMKKILEFEQMQEELTTTLEERKEELGTRDENFELLQDQYLDLEKVNKNLEDLIYDSQRYLETVSRKVNEAVEATTRAQIRMKYTMGILARTLLLFSLIKMNPRPKANAVTAATAIVAIDLVRNLLKPKIEKRMVTEYHCPDYRAMIENALSDIHSVSDLIQNGLSQVQDLQKTFVAEFREYADVLPEYKELLSSITKIEKELKEREDNMRRVENDMKHQLSKNNQKVLEYEKLNARNCA